MILKFNLRPNASDSPSSLMSLGLGMRLVLGVLILGNDFDKFDLLAPWR